MRWAWALAGLSAAALGCASAQKAAAPAGPGPSAERALEGQRVTLTLPSFPSGAPHSLTRDLGQVVLLDVWATWCEPCRDALPVYDGLFRRYGAQGLKVYGVNVDEDADDVAPFLKATGVALPVLRDPEGRVAEEALHVRLMPTTFLVDRRGVVRHVHEGYSPETVAQLQAEIEALLKEPAR